MTWETRLENLKLLAQSESEKDQALAQFEIGGHLFEVKDHGARRFPFILTDNCYLIKLSRSTASSLPLAHVQVSSEYLMAVGAEKATANLQPVIAMLGGHDILDSIPSISRVDVFLDFSCTINFDDLDQHCWVTRAHLLAKYYDRRLPCPFTGWVTGIGGSLSARLYDKTAEIDYKSHKEYMYELWSPQGWQKGQSVWRQEFQLRRDPLKQLGIEYLEELLEKQKSLWAYLTQDWLRLAIPNQNDATRSRWLTHPVWQAVSAAFSPDTDQPRLTRFQPQRMPSNNWIFMNGLGGLTSFMAREGIDDFGEGLGEFLHQANDFHLHRSQHQDGMYRYIRQKVALKGRRYNSILNSSENTPAKNENIEPDSTVHDPDKPS